MAFKPKLKVADRGKDPCPEKCPKCDGTCNMSKGHPRLLDHVCNNNKNHKW